MASNLRRRGLANVGKRLVDGNWRENFRAATPVSAGRRCTHSSVYDKNVEEQVRPAVVPDGMIGVRSDEYWAPDPKTGVFGPADKNVISGLECVEAQPPKPVNDSVLREKVWFRPLQDVEKPEAAQCE